MESYLIPNLKGDTKVLLIIFYIGLALHHRRLLDSASKGNFIELDTKASYEVLEGILGVPPPKKGLAFHKREFKFSTNWMTYISTRSSCKNIMNLSNILVGTSIA